MPARWGLGPVFVFEWLLASRRWQMYAVRALVVGVLFGALLLVWEAELRDRFRLDPQPLSYKDYGRIGTMFFYAVIGTQLSLILLAAPGATAGAVCLDKMRGNLLLLLVTDLSAAEIVLGKLASRLLPVLGLVACSLPVLMICTFLGGMDPYAVAGAYAVMLGVGVFGTALALLLSVWGRKPHEVLLVTFTIEILWLLAELIYRGMDAALFKTGSAPPWLHDLNPFVLAFAPYNRPGTVEASDYGWFLLATLGAAAACTLLAVVSVRPAALSYGAVTRKPKAAPAHARRRWGPVLDRNPLLWYEWHRRRPSRWTRAVWALYGGFAVISPVAVMYGWLFGGGPAWVGAFFVNTFLPPIGLLLAGVTAVTALADERARGNLDILLGTPLPTRAIVWAKWRAAFRPIPRIVALPVLLCAMIAGYENGGWEFVVLLGVLLLACGLFLTSLGLALATAIPRVGRAIAYSVGLFAYQCLGWPITTFLLFESTAGGQLIGPTLLSPLFTGAMLTQVLHTPSLLRSTEASQMLEWGWLWVGALLTAAAGLYLLTLLSFDRCLGRVPERGLRRRRPWVVKGDKVTVAT